MIATPGRLKDIMERQGEKLNLRSLEILILDEADVLLVLAVACSHVGPRTHEDDRSDSREAAEAASNGTVQCDGGGGGERACSSGLAQPC